MNNEKLYQEQKAFIKKKYWDNILSLNTYHGGMSTDICIAVLCENARAHRDGRTKEIWNGMGKIDMKELITDVEKLDTFIVHQ